MEAKCQLRPAPSHPPKSNSLGKRHPARPPNTGLAL